MSDGALEWNRSTKNASVTKARVHSAALELFARHGYRGTSLRDIASAVGVQAGSLYNHIASKEDLLFELLSGSITRRIAALHDTGSIDDPIQRLCAAVDVSIRGKSGSSRETFVAQSELRALAPQHRAAVIELRDAYEREWAMVLQFGMDTGVFHVADVKLTVYAIIAIVQQVDGWYQDSGRLTLQEVSRRYQLLLLTAVGACPDGTPESFPPSR